MRLPYYGPKQIIPGAGKHGRADTLFHSIPAFSFVNQDGLTITDNSLQGKIYVADFFFASCKSICPKIASNLGVLQTKFQPKDSIYILSHTVTPEADSVPVLKQYSLTIHADTKSWYFLTGDKKAIYDIAFKGYLLNAVDDTTAVDIQNRFLHDNHLVLVDKEKHIRGIYDGTSLPDVNKLIDDIHMLKADYVRQAEAALAKKK